MLPELFERSPATVGRAGAAETGCQVTVVNRNGYECSTNNCVGGGGGALETELRVLVFAQIERHDSWVGIGAAREGSVSPMSANAT